jgi:hypothetical protein
MKYLLSVIDDSTGSATSDELAAIDAFNGRHRTEGHRVFAGGLGSPNTATVMALKLAAERSKHCNRKVEVRPFLADPV